MIDEIAIRKYVCTVKENYYFYIDQRTNIIGNL